MIDVAFAVSYSHILGTVIAGGVLGCAKWLRSVDRSLLKMNGNLSHHLEETHPTLDKRIDRIEERL